MEYAYDKGKHQATFNVIRKAVPISGPSLDPVIEVFRLFNNWVYRVYNDGDDNFIKNSRTHELVKGYKSVKNITENCPLMDAFFKDAIESEKYPNPYDDIDFDAYGEDVEITIKVNPSRSDKELNEILDEYLAYVRNNAEALSLGKLFTKK